MFECFAVSFSFVAAFVCSFLLRTSVRSSCFSHKGKWAPKGWTSFSMGLSALWRAFVLLRS